MEVPREAWVARYDGPQGGWNSVQALTLDSSGNLDVTGTSTSAPTGSQSDFVTLKYDPAGMQLRLARSCPS